MEQLLVLVVEDELLIQMELEETLREGGFQTCSETTGEAAIGKLESDPQIRAVITDVNLGGPKTGWDVARRARELMPELPVVYVTSSAKTEWASEGVPESILIRKPYVPAQIITAVSQLLNAGDGPDDPLTL
ncbi:response regulator [Mesorhizobium sp. 10J20-29]